MSSVRVVQTATTRILRQRFPGASEMVGQGLNLFGDYNEK